MKLTISQAARNLHVAIATVNRYGEKLGIDPHTFTIQDQEKVRDLLKEESQCPRYSKQRAWEKYTASQDALTIQELSHITGRNPGSIKMHAKRNNFGHINGSEVFVCSPAEALKVVEHWENKPKKRSKNGLKTKSRPVSTIPAITGVRRTIPIGKVAKWAGVCNRTIHYHIRKHGLGVIKGGKYLLSKVEAEQVLGNYRTDMPKKVVSIEPVVKSKTVIPVQSNYLVISNENVHGLDSVEQVKDEIRKNEDVVVFQKMTTAVNVTLG